MSTEAASTKASSTEIDPPVSGRRAGRVLLRALSKAWDDSIFAESAQAAFWCALSLPPLLLGMLGSLAYVAPLFGPFTLQTIEDRLISTANSLFSRNVVTEIIQPTISDIVAGARGEIVSFGFVISLWAGSSAISAFVDAVTEAHDQTPLRHPVRQRFYALGLYVVMLLGVIVTAPIIALGPIKIATYIPDSWDAVLRYGYYPVLFLGLAIAVLLLYRVALPRPLPTHRLVLGSALAAVVFLVATLCLKFYLTWITATGYTYGALATPIAFLLFAFFLGFSIMIGAELNAAIAEQWPAPQTHAHRLRGWLEDKAGIPETAKDGAEDGAEHSDRDATDAGTNSAARPEVGTNGSAARDSGAGPDGDAAGTSAGSSTASPAESSAAARPGPAS